MKCCVALGMSVYPYWGTRCLCRQERLGFAVIDSIPGLVMAILLIR